MALLAGIASGQGLLGSADAWRWASRSVGYLLRFEGRRVEISQVDQFGRKRMLAGEQAN